MRLLDQRAVLTLQRLAVVLEQVWNLAPPGRQAAVRNAVLREAQAPAPYRSSDAAYEVNVQRV
jgi:hypothetical protein